MRQMVTFQLPLKILCCTHECADPRYKGMSKEQASVSEETKNQFKQSIFFIS